MRKNELSNILSPSLGRHKSTTHLLKSIAVDWGTASTSSDVLFSMIPQLATFTGMSGSSNQTSSAGVAKDMTDQMAQLRNELSQLRGIQQTSIGSVTENTQALVQNTVAKASSGASTLSTIGSAASSVFGGGLAVSPIITGLLSLFGGNKNQAISPLVPFSLPPTINYQGGLAAGGGQVVPLSYGTGGQPRPVSQPQAQPVTIQVQAMDSRSFLDHSDDIANAVRQAILQSNPLNDVIADL